ncbi:hypothetical protein P4S72_23480 [Vibrio sp. PP-XX7]
MGFSLASPALYLSGGKRVVRLRVGRGADTEDTPLQLKTWLDISVSTAEGMVSLMMPDPDEDVAEPPAWSLAENVPIDETDGVHDLVITFDALFPAITGLDGDLALGVSPLPHVLFLLKPEKEAEAFVLEKQIFTTLTLDISVQGLGADCFK